MCVLAFAWRVHEHFPMVIAGNRDEFHERPTAPAHWWEDHPELLAGRDLREGGTWMGLSRRGRFAVVTNIREQADTGDAEPRSRGGLVTDFLTSERSPAAWAADLDTRNYRGFNLIFGDLEQALYLSSRGISASVLKPGVYGLSNHLLDTPWPKVVTTRDVLVRCLNGEYPNVDGIFRALADPQQAEDPLLPETGVPLEWERRLSSVFIVHPVYGTRASTVMMWDRSGKACLEERGFTSSGENQESRQFEFALEASPGHSREEQTVSVRPRRHR
jgi:uncharacterized protein with NRDE domain